jgi:hypothetical protein
MLWQCWAFVGIMSDLYLAAWPILRPFFKQIEKQDQEQTCHPAKPKLTMLAIASDLRVRTKKASRHLWCGRISLKNVGIHCRTIFQDYPWVPSIFL